MPEAERVRADDYARRGQEAFDAGEREKGLMLATHALVVRLAACAYECPDVAYSFVELGDMRLARGEVGHAAQSYRRALEVLEPHAASHQAWIAATRRRLVHACKRLEGAGAACSGLSANSPPANGTPRP
jgi:hypothetical protein